MLDKLFEWKRHIVRSIRKHRLLPMPSRCAVPAAGLD